MATTTQTSTNPQKSYKNAYLLNEVSQALVSLGENMGNSVALFDAVGEKNEVFKTFEKSVQNPLDSVVQLTYSTRNIVWEYLFDEFFSLFQSNKEHINFVHFVKKTDSLIFYISVKNDEFRKKLEDMEYNYFTKEISETFGLEFCFLEEDMQKDLSNTEKVILQ